MSQYLAWGFPLIHIVEIFQINDSWSLRPEGVWSHTHTLTSCKQWKKNCSVTSAASCRTAMLETMLTNGGQVPSRCGCGSGRLGAGAGLIRHRMMRDDWRTADHRWQDDDVISAHVLIWTDRHTFTSFAVLSVETLPHRAIPLHIIGTLWLPVEPFMCYITVWYYSRTGTALLFWRDFLPLFSFSSSSSVVKKPSLYSSQSQKLVRFFPSLWNCPAVAIATVHKAHPRPAAVRETSRRRCGKVM